MKRDDFYGVLRGSTAFPKLTVKQVEGMDLLLDVWAMRYADNTPIAFLAAALTEIHHETGGRMQPVMETYSSTPAGAAAALERAYVKGRLPWVERRYWTPDSNGLIWIGRGDVQITHKANYTKQRKNFKETYDVDIPLDENPELAMHPVVSAEIAYQGMIKGLFREAKLEDFFKDGEMDYVGQRDTISGDKRDKVIAAKMERNGKLFERALKKAGADAGMEPLHERQLPGVPVEPRKDVDVTPVLTKGENRIMEIQERLIVAGYGEIVGKADGDYGPKTRKAIEAFEAANNIKLDHIDAATWERLQGQTAEEA